MNAASTSLPRWFNAILWGNSVALSWMWGLGLFFSVQFSIQFGLVGLLCFAVPNALGLWIFGLVTHHLARRQEGSESLAKLFDTWWRPFRVLFYFYQLLAISLTVFAFIRYAWQPLGLKPDLLYLPLTMLVAIMAGILFGEEFPIRRIKWSHGAIFLGIFLAIVLILISLSGKPRDWNGLFNSTRPADFVGKLSFWGYFIPILVGFLLGPWLDLQQWQRAIQMHRERCSIAAAYAIGSFEFFLLLLFHGTLALWALATGGNSLLREGLAPWLLGHDNILRVLFAQAADFPWTFGAYCFFISACLLTTLDSGYVALRWFLQKSSRTSTSAIIAFFPRWIIESPFPSFLLAGVIALAAAALHGEIEYFMIFYATFFVGYAALGISRCFVPPPASGIPHVKMFCIGSLSLIIFAYGYFLSYPAFMIFGSLAPLGYVIWLLLKPTKSEDFASGSEDLAKPADYGALPPRPETETPTQADDKPLAPATAAREIVAGVEGAVQAVSSALQNIRGHFEGKWFVHSFVATYADTNSVGNVYFGMYAMWVGKTRELFFNRVMPKFNLKTTPYYILTRSFEHKFIRETREFETVSVKIRIASYNRKFVTLEHEIYDSAGRLLGKGNQTLMFVSSADYKLIDIPAEVAAAFMQHA